MECEVKGLEAFCTYIEKNQEVHTEYDSTDVPLDLFWTSSSNHFEPCDLPESKAAVSNYEDIQHNNVDFTASQDFHKYLSSYHLWLYWLESAYKPNLLFYGIGSKQSLIDYFIESCIRNLYSIIKTFQAYKFTESFYEFLLDTVICVAEFKKVNLTDVQLPRQVKKLTDFLVNLLTDSKEKSSRKSKRSTESNKFKLCLVIHNLDSPNILKYQSYLATLASLENVSFICSAYNWMYPSIWNINDLDKFNFYHIHLPTPFTFDSEFEDVSIVDWAKENNEPEIITLKEAQAALSILPPRCQELASCIATYCFPQYNNDMAKDWPSIDRDLCFEKASDELIYNNKQKFDAAIQELVDQRLLKVVEDKKIFLVVPKEVILTLFPEVEETNSKSGSDAVSSESEE